MAYQARYIAGVQSGDRAKLKASAAVYVSQTDAQAWYAAADHTARMATDVGLLLLALNDAQESDGTNAIYKFYVNMDDINDAYAPPAYTTEVLNSNKIKLTYSTTNNGIPVTESIYIPQRTDLTKNSDGRSYNITVSPFVNMNTQLVATGLSSYGTAITAIVEAIPNDI